MIGRRLVIGLSASFLHADPLRNIFKGKTLLFAEQSLFHWVMSQGALPMLFPPSGGAIRAADQIDAVDGFLLQGGADVSPRTYGEEPVKPEWQGDAVRDAYEIELIKECLAARKPLLGVCRGAQVLNVALGGTLFQDLELQHPGHRNHRNWEIYDQHAHEIAFAEGALLEGWYGHRTRPFVVNSVHHQGIKDLGRDLVVEARSMPDGVVEAIRYVPAGDATPPPWVYGVQWHPEFMQDGGRPDFLEPRPILDAFFAAVRADVAARGTEGTPPS